MDKNSAIGLTLIAALLLAYFYWFAPEPKPPVEKISETKQAIATDSTPKAAVQIDSALIKDLGDLGSYVNGQEATSQFENQDVKITFSNKGGTIKEVELKHYKTYGQKPLKLVDPESNQFSLISKYQGKDLDLYALYYAKEESKNADTTIVTYKIQLSNGAVISHTYKIPEKGYEIKYSLNIKGLEQQLNGNNLVFHWIDLIRPMEKDLQETRNHTTITYYEVEDGFDNLNARSSSTEKETFTAPLKWVSIKQKFFLASIIAEDNFSGGELEIAANAADSSIVKRADVKLNIKPQQGTADFKFYIGPNDYHIIGGVTERFADNVELGWRPVYWINKFAIFPVFNFLTKFISNYGVIIIILVILLKLVLAPLSYRSYLSMAKMKVLKPELDEIKARVGDDMAKVQQEQLKLYQQVGVNPISGCIPVLLQMPILFAMFYLFPASIELRQQPFLWAEDLSTYDSIIRLPFTMPFGVGSHISLFTLLMTAATLIYTWQNNQISSVTGPMKTMSYVMPVIFFFVLNSFSAGLTFYYFVSTMATFGQQALIRKFVDDNKIKTILEENRKKNASGGGTKSKFMNKLQEAMKAGEEARKKTDEGKKKKK